MIRRIRLAITHRPDAAVNEKRGGSVFGRRDAGRRTAPPLLPPPLRVGEGAGGEVHSPIGAAVPGRRPGPTTRAVARAFSLTAAPGRSHGASKRTAGGRWTGGQTTRPVPDCVRCVCKQRTRSVTAATPREAAEPRGARRTRAAESVTMAIVADPPAPVTTTLGQSWGITEWRSTRRCLVSDCVSWDASRILRRGGGRDVLRL